MRSPWQPPVPVKVRTARKQHTCDDCGKPIEPGDAYELCVTPPHRISEYDVDHWLTWRTHYPRHGNRFLQGCDEAAAYRENARRDRAAQETAVHDCPAVATVGETRYPCRSHEGNAHHFAMHWPACPAPFCRLPPGHRGLHDVPSGRAEVLADA